MYQRFQKLYTREQKFKHSSNFLSNSNTRRASIDEFTVSKRGVKEKEPLDLNFCSRVYLGESRDERDTNLLMLSKNLIF